MNEAKEEIRSRLNIEDVIGEYVELKRTGRNFKGLSPFNEERTPSFIVSPEKNIWHDFSSNKGGDIFTFIMEVEGLSFREALELLAKKANVDLSQYNDKKQMALASKKKRLYEINELAVSFFEYCLTKSKKASEYVYKKRQLSQEIVKDFRIGFAPNERNTLIKFLLKKGYSKRDILDAGLTNRFGGDIFRSRMIVSLMDPTGRVIGFTGRIIEDLPNAPKYLNTPQTLLYNKSFHIFGLSQAKEAIRKTNSVVLVEGNLDVVSSHQAGVRQVVATAGTAMTEHHLRGLARLTDNIILCFDGDKAGVNATERAIYIAQNLDINLKVISIPAPYKDPDEMIKADLNGWKELVSGGIPAADWVLNKYQKEQDLKTAKGQKSYSDIALKLINALKDPIEQEFYLKKVAKTLDTTVDVLLRKKVEEKVPQKEFKKVKKVKDNNEEEYKDLDELLALCLFDSSLRPRLKELNRDLILNDKRATIYDNLISESLSGEQLISTLKKYEEYVNVLSVIADEKYKKFNEEERREMCERLITKVTLERLAKFKMQLTEALRDAEYRKDETQIMELLNRIKNINKEMSSAKKEKGFRS